MSLSLKPSDANSMAGLADSVVTIRNPIFLVQPFEGKDAKGKTITLEKTRARLQFELEGVDNLVTRSYNVSDSAIIVPGPDGFTLEAAEGRDPEQTRLNDKSAWIQFTQHLVDAGFPEDAIQDDIRFLEGVRVQLMEKVEVYKNLKDEHGNAQESRREVPQKYLGRVAGGAASAKAGNGKPVSAVAQADQETDDRSAIEAAMLTILSEGPVSKPQLVQKINSAFAANRQLQLKALKLVSSDVYLKSSATWKFDGKQVALVQ